jgi:regulatory protein YycI of two-component signal transduction system YycFG
LTDYSNDNIAIQHSINQLFTEGLKEERQQDNDADAENNQEQQLSLSTQAYNLFSEVKTPIEVAIELYLRESQATKFFRVLKSQTTTYGWSRRSSSYCFP